MIRDFYLTDLSGAIEALTVTLWNFHADNPDVKVIGGWSEVLEAIGCEVHTLCMDGNYGLARSIVMGVREQVRWVEPLTKSVSARFNDVLTEIGNM